MTQWSQGLDRKWGAQKLHSTWTVIKNHQKSKTQGYRTVGFAPMFTIFWNILQFCLENKVQQRRTNSKTWTTKILDPKQKSSHRNDGLGLWSAVFYSWNKPEVYKTAGGFTFCSNESERVSKDGSKPRGRFQGRDIVFVFFAFILCTVIIHDTTGDWLWCCVFCILDVLLKGQGGDCCKDFAAWMNID